MTKLTNKWLLIYLFLPLFVLNFAIIGENLHVYLAYSFLKGSLSLIKIPLTLTDLSLFDGKYFLPIGPFPAIFFMPFVALFKLNFQEGFLKLPLAILNFWLVYQIAKTLKISLKKSILLAIFFVFGSVYTPVTIVPFSVYFAQVVGTSLLLIALYEFLNKKRYLLIGILLALGILTRATLVVSTLFFIIYLLQKPIYFKNIIKFIAPILVSLMIIGIYNYSRFGNFWEVGYKYQIIPDESAQRRAQGLFSLKHIPANLFYMLIKTPDPILKDDSHVLKFPYLKFDNYGMSIFFLSPILFLIFKTDLKNRLVRISSITILAILVPIITYYGIGYRQVGYRYALDFFPFLLIPLMSSVKKISETPLIILVIAGVIITWFFTIEMLLGI